MPRTATARPMFRTTAAPLALVLALAACGGGDQGGEGGGAGASDTVSATAAPPAGQTATTPPAGGSAADTVNDANIFAILDASNQVEIQPSQLAQEKAQNPQLKAYAQRMVTEHTALGDSMRALAQRINVTPTPHPLSEALGAQVQATMQKLQGLSGMDFDTAYASAMAMSHQQTLSTAEQRLVPRAQNAELKSALEQKVRPAVQMHLQQIQGIQSSLGGGGQPKQ